MCTLKQAEKQLKSQEVKRWGEECGEEGDDEGGNECSKQYSSPPSQSQQVIIFCYKVQMRHFVVEKSTSILVFSSSTW